MAVQRAQPAGARVPISPTDIQLSDAAADPHWLRFQDEEGKVRGTISLNPNGTTLYSKNGDFAEYHKRDPREAAFEEGDLVGFGAHGLTRQTNGVLQVGVITRRAIVTGTCPDSDELDGYDTVAYVGMVPVKLRGTAANGHFVAPSGRADGTAVATSWRPAMSVGRICEVDADVGDRCCACTKRRQAVRLSTIAVFNPADSVRGQLESTSSRLAQRAARMVAVLLVVILMWIGFRLRCPVSQQLCEPVSLPHGQLSGICDGTCGSSCTYEGCDAGYILVARDDRAASTAAHAPALFSGAQERSKSPAHTRTCSSGDTRAALMRSTEQRTYTGIEMSCVRTVCPPETVSVGCGNCGSENLSVWFPEVPWSSEQVVRSCPGGFKGTAERTCGPSGWSAVRSHCLRLQCPQTEIPLSGGPATMSYEQQQRCYQSRVPTERMTNPRRASGRALDRETKLLCEKLFQHTATLKTTISGFGRLAVECPSPQYSGSISATCAPNASAWEHWSDGCHLQFCPAEWRRLTFSGNRTDNISRTHAVRVHLPQQEAVAGAEGPDSASGGALSVSQSNEVAHASSAEVWSIVPCCNQLSPTGSCLDQNASYGYITSRCARNDDGALAQQVWSSRSWVTVNDSTVLQEGCRPLDEGVTGVRMDQNSMDAAVLYRELAHTLREEFLPSIQKLWTLPLNGSLSSISVSMRDVSTGVRATEWRPVMSVPRPGADAAIDTSGLAGTESLDPFVKWGKYHRSHELGAYSTQ